MIQKDLTPDEQQKISEILIRKNFLESEKGYELRSDALQAAIQRYADFYDLDVSAARDQLVAMNIPDYCIKTSSTMVTLGSYTYLPSCTAPNIRYRIGSFTPNLSQSSVIQAIRSAFFTWSYQCFTTFTETSGQDEDILIEFNPYDGPNSTIGVTDYELLRNKITLDVEENWTAPVGDNPPYVRYDVESVALHEIGHALGLDHLSGSSDVMLAGDLLPAALRFTPRRVLSNNDIAYLQGLHGRRQSKGTLRDSSFGAPAHTTFTDDAGKIISVLAWTGNDDDRRLNVMKSDNLRVWYDKHTLWEGSDATPSLTTLNNRLYLCWTGRRNNKINIMCSDDGINWFNKVTLNEYTEHTPCLYVHNFMFYLAFTGKDKNRSLNLMQSTDARRWHSKITLAKESAEDGPSLCTVDTDILLAWRGNDKHVRLNTIRFDGARWFNKTTLNESSLWRPNLCNINGVVYMLWTGLDLTLGRGYHGQPWNLNVLQSNDGQNFYDKQVIQESALQSPAAGISSTGRLIIFWTGRDMNSYLNYWLPDF